MERNSIDLLPNKLVRPTDALKMLESREKVYSDHFLSKEIHLRQLRCIKNYHAQKAKPLFGNNSNVPAPE